MPIDRVVCNASPLIVLFKCGHADLLGRLWDEVAVPIAVWREVSQGGHDDVAACGLPDATWAKQVEVPRIDPTIAGWALGAGESEVLSFALQHPGYRAMLDDAQARSCARSMGIATLGTGATLVLAKRRGLIPSVGQALADVRRSGLWLPDHIATILRQQAGE